MVKKITLLLLGSLFAVSSFADNAHVPCNLTDPDKALKAAAEKRVEGIVRAPAAEVEGDEPEAID